MPPDEAAFSLFEIYFCTHPENKAVNRYQAVFLNNLMHQWSKDGFTQETFLRLKCGEGERYSQDKELIFNYSRTFILLSHDVHMMYFVFSCDLLGEGTSSNMCAWPFHFNDLLIHFNSSDGYQKHTSAQPMCSDAFNVCFGLIFKNHAHFNGVKPKRACIIILTWAVEQTILTSVNINT